MGFAEENIVSRVFARHGLRLDPELSYGQVGHDPKHPYVKVESLIKTLEKVGKLHKLIGLGEACDTLQKAGPGLAKFWESFRHSNSGHEVFNGILDLSCCVPVYLHGDEGTTYKRDGVFVMSLHTPLGRGTLSNKLGRWDDSSGDPHTNFAGHSFETRFLLGALLRESQRMLNSSFLFKVV